MAGQEPVIVPTHTGERGAQDELLLQAAAVLRTRYGTPGRDHELSPPSAAELGNTLTAMATSEQPVADADRETAVALAHRLIDDDHPELSPMWPGTSG